MAQAMKRAALFVGRVVENLAGFGHRPMARAGPCIIKFIGVIGSSASDNRYDPYAVTGAGPSAARALEVPTGWTNLR